jgi:hypothetical protein
MRTDTIVRGVGFTLGMLALSGCGTTEESAGTSRSALGVPATFKVELPTGVGLHQAAVGATSSLEISDRSRVVTVPAGFAAITNVGTAGSRIGVEAQTGDAWSLGTLVLANNARVNGSVHAPNGLTLQPNAVITGATDQTTPITPHTFSWVVDFVSGTTPINVEPDVTKPLAPGAYASVSVKSRAKLLLKTGTYYLQSLQAETGSTLVLDTQQGPIFVYVSQGMTHRGFNQYTGDENAALFAYLGTQSVALGGPFTGSVVAPNAEVALSPGTDPAQPNRKGFKGSFFGKRVWAQPDLTLTHAPFKHWDFVLPPQPFVVCVSKVGKDRYAALFGYDNPLDRAATIAAGTDNSLAGVLPGSGVSPITSFSSGRVEQGLWVPFANEVTWSLRGKTAKATRTSPECPASAYPSNPTPLALSGVRGEGPSQDIAPSTPKAPDFSPPPAVSPAQIESALLALPAGTASAVQLQNSAKGNVAMQVLGAATGSFVFKLTSIHVPDGDTGSNQEPYVSKFQINGENKSTGSLGSCEEDTTCNINFSAQHDVPLQQAVVDVAIDIKEDDDSSGDDNELQVRLKVDNVTGQVLSGTAHSTDPDTTNNIAAGAGCGGAESWNLCWEVQSAGVPTVPGNVAVCAFWNAYFVDEGKGESRTGIAVPQGTDPQPPAYKAYTASYARAQLQVRSAFAPDVAVPFILDTSLDVDGCYSVPAQLLVHRADATTVGDGDLGITMVMGTQMNAPGGITYNITDQLKPSPTDPNSFPLAQVTMGTGNVSPGAEIDENAWPKTGQWHVPPPVVQVFHKGHTPMTNTAAAITAVLTATDAGIVPGTYHVMVNTGLELPDLVNVDSTGGSGLLSVGPSHTISECVSQDPMTGICLTWNYSKPPCTTSAQCEGVMECLAPLPADCFTAGASKNPACMNSEACAPGQAECYCRLPHQARWKYVVAHEAGHQIQQRAAGDFSNAEYGFVCPSGTTPGSPQCPGRLSQYTVGGVVDPPWVADTCGCAHVKAANQEHCLQSIERGGPAQSEGFAQFYAARSWNDEVGDCSFTYYKEFLDTACRSLNSSDCKLHTTAAGQQLFSTLPPVQVGCRQPARWRNKQECSIVSGASGKAGDYGTEYDWMGFLYSINRPTFPTTPRVPTSDVWLIYRHACTQAEAPFGTPPKAVPDMCSGRPFVWDTSNTSVAAGSPKVGGFVQGLDARYVTDPTTRDKARADADLFGVSADTSPLP